MSLQNIIRTLVEYHVASNRKLWDHLLEHLAGDQFTQEVGFSHGSIRNQVVHLAATDHYWLHDIQSKPVTGLDPEDFPTPESFTKTWESIGESLLAYVRSLTDEQLEEFPDGLVETRWQALVHVVNHGTDHRAQILSMLHGLGIPTFGQDFAFYLREIRRMSVSDVLELIRNWNGRVQQALEQVPPQRVAEPLDGEWSLKDRVAQHSWYDREMAEVLEHRQLPDTGLWKLSRQERDFQLSVENKDQSWEEVVERRAEAHSSLVEAIERLEDEDLNDPLRFRGMPAGVKPWELLEKNTWSRYMALSEALWGWLDGE